MILSGQYNHKRNERLHGQMSQRMLQSEKEYGHLVGAERRVRSKICMDKHVEKELTG